MAKARRQRSTRIAPRKNAPQRQPRRPTKRTDRERQALRKDTDTLARALREARRELRHMGTELARLQGIEREAKELRCELGPQRPLLTLPEVPVTNVRESWLPALVERHLTALNDHDVDGLDGLLAPDVVLIDTAFPDDASRGAAEVAGYHTRLFANWADFRFMPRHWHNLGGAAFLEGDASFAPRGEWQGVTTNGQVVTVDMLLVYYLSGQGLTRIKLYYDAARIHRQMMTPPRQGALL